MSADKHPPTYSESRAAAPDYVIRALVDWLHIAESISRDYTSTTELEQVYRWVYGDTEEGA